MFDNFDDVELSLQLRDAIFDYFNLLFLLLEKTTEHEQLLEVVDPGRHPLHDRLEEVPVDETLLGVEVRLLDVVGDLRDLLGHQVQLVLEDLQENVLVVACLLILEYDNCEEDPSRTHHSSRLSEQVEEVGHHSLLVLQHEALAEVDHEGREEAPCNGALAALAELYAKVRKNPVEQCVGQKAVLGQDFRLLDDHLLLERLFVF